MLGLLSLYEVQLFLKKRIGTIASWILATGAIFLCGFGIYIGRFLRWNSWDVVMQPDSLFSELFKVMTNPAAENGMGITLVLSVFLLIAYLKMVLLIGNKKPN